jgi:hypothetical protein
MGAIRGSCLCGDVAWEVSGPLEMMSHCHCSRCRKSHGTAFATFLMCTPDAFRLLRGGERMRRYESSPGLYRTFCAGCGAVVPIPEPTQGLVAVPAGPLDDDPGARPVAHIFTGSKAPWYEIRDALPQVTAFPPGFDAPELPDLGRGNGGTLGGSCLCGAIAFVIDGPLLRAWNCHCSRCRKARAAAHASNLFTANDGVRFTRGADLLVAYKLPTAKFFTHTFCRTCGSPMPRVNPARPFAVVPMGALDDDPGIRPQRHIFAASKAPWYDIPPGLPQDAEFPSEV